MTPCANHPTVPARWRIVLPTLTVDFCGKCFRAWEHPKNGPSAQVSLIPAKSGATIAPQRPAPFASA
jgi:hypothetical protein